MSAIVVAWLLHRGIVGGWLVRIWNLVAAALLVNILYVAIASTPIFAAYGPERLNTWVAFPPFIWLPAMMVVFAMAGHLLIWRALR